MFTYRPVIHKPNEAHSEVGMYRHAHFNVYLCLIYRCTEYMIGPLLYHMGGLLYYSHDFGFALDFSLQIEFTIAHFAFPFTYFITYKQ